VKEKKKLPERLINSSIKKIKRDIMITEFQIDTLKKDFESIRDTSLKRVIDNWLERKQEKLEYLRKSLINLKKLRK